jgi:hypothetical protein
MITFKKTKFFKRAMMFFSKSYKAKCEAETKAAIRFLVDNPMESCKIDEEIILNGYDEQTPN